MVTQKLPFKDARRIVRGQSNGKPFSYASVATNSVHHEILKVPTKEVINSRKKISCNKKVNVSKRGNPPCVPLGNILKDDAVISDPLSSEPRATPRPSQNGNSCPIRNNNSLSSVTRDVQPRLRTTEEPIALEWKNKNETDTHQNVKKRKKGWPKGKPRKIPS